MSLRLPVWKTGQRARALTEGHSYCELAAQQASQVTPGQGSRPTGRRGQINGKPDGTCSPSHPAAHAGAAPVKDASGLTILNHKVFSFVPRCQGECGSQKYTVAPV